MSPVVERKVKDLRVGWRFVYPWTATEIAEMLIIGVEQVGYDFDITYVHPLFGVTRWQAVNPSCMVKVRTFDS